MNIHVIKAHLVHSLVYVIYVQESNTLQGCPKEFKIHGQLKLILNVFKIQPFWMFSAHISGSLKKKICNFNLTIS